MGKEQWFISPGVRGAPATGFIADRFKNFRARNLSVVEKEELGIGQIKINIKEKIIKYQGTEDSSVEFLQKQQWLKENTSPDKIEAEFKMLYGEQKSDSLCLGFGMTANLIIHQAKHCGRNYTRAFGDGPRNFEPWSVTWTTPELAPPLLTTTPHQREDVSTLQILHRCPTRRVFSGTGLEPVTKQATVRYLYHSATAATK
ncbi:uncharacterized protein TNCV_765291 [Trichonephila clavipes]|nr:uncharacterized protein TNCV_765291 [Trichonephila clavipes]